jgi:predicted lactoylglutathione lyase
MKMNYFVFGTNNKEKAIAFYDELFAGSGLNKIQDQGRMILWGNEDFMFAIAEPFDEKSASNGNGTMLGFHAETKEEVDRLHTKALDLGGVSEGEPTMRSNMHSAYVRDLDNNKICFYTSNA